LAEVLAIDFDGAGGIPKLNRDFRWADQEQAVLSACSSLIAIVKNEVHVASGSTSLLSSEPSSLHISPIDEDSRRVQFSHFSVKEFLSSDRLVTSELAALRFHHIPLESAHAIMAQACLGVLLHLDNSMDKKTIEGYPLAKYAGEFFANHAKAGDVLSQNNNGIDHLLDLDMPHFNPWLWLQCGDVDQKDLDFNVDTSSESDESSSDRSSSEHLYPTYPPRISSLYYTSLLGHQYLTRHLILKRPQDLGASDVYGRTPLHWAVYTLDFEATRMLLDRTMDINARDSRGWTPLHYVMVENAKVEDDQKLQNDHFRCARLLLERGVDAEAQDSRGTTPLHVAASNVRRKIVQLLIENVTNIHMRNDQGQTALHKASRRGNTDIISIILNRGADVDAQDNGGSTPLHLVISSVIPWDAQQDAQQAVGVLLEHGADINLRNHEGQTALHKASLLANPHVIHHIPNHGADVDAQDNDGSTPLHLIISKVSMDSEAFVDSEPHREVIKLLLEHGASGHRENNQGETPFEVAAARGLQEITGLLSIHIQSGRTA
jgi:ankyrin repeat protein